MAFRSYVNLNRRDRALVALAALGMIIVLIMTLIEVLARGRGDAQVFFRAGWAIWTGHDIYNVTDDHGWSCHYPPFFALLMAPFANAPHGVELPWWAAPFPLAIILWYFIGVAALAAAAHTFAKTIGRRAPACGSASHAIGSEAALLGAAIPLITCLYAESTARRGTLKLSRAEIAWVVAAIVSFFATGNNSPGILAPLGPTTIVMFAPIVAGVAALRRLPAREGQPAETSPVSGLGGEPARTG